MNDISRKKRRKAQQSLEVKRSTNLLKTVLLPLLLLITIIFLIYVIKKSENLIPFSKTEKKQSELVVKEKKYADIYTWEELVEALSNRELTEINVKKDIKFPQYRKDLTVNKVIDCTEEKILHYDETLKKEQRQIIFRLRLVTQNLNRKVVLRGEKRIIHLGKLELDLPKGLELELKEVTLVRNFQY